MTRKLTYSGANVEGWAHYTEEMVIEAGYERTDKSSGLPDKRSSPACLSIYLRHSPAHSGNVGERDANFFVHEGFQEEANGDREAKRGTMEFNLPGLYIWQAEDYRNAEEF